MKNSETGIIQLMVLNSRLIELQQELKEFALLEVEATNQRDKIKWALRVAETKELISMNQTGIEVTEELMSIQSKLDNIDNCDIAGFMDIMQGMADIFKKIED